MSLEELPTELDVAIIDYLGQGDLAELSRVSKYYRKLAEPRLYDSIQFRDHHEVRVKLLLFTLIKRKDLRSSIHHFSLRHAPRAPWPEAPDLAPQIIEPFNDGAIDLCDLLMAHAPRITKLVSDLAHTYKINSHLKMEMFAKVFIQHPRYDGALALILCLTTKVVSIQLDVVNEENLSMTRFMLEAMEWTSGPSMYDYPFCALKLLQIQGVDSQDDIYCGSFDAGVQPAMETLELCNNADLCVISLPQTLPSQTVHLEGRLNTLTLRDVNFDPSMLETLVASPWCANLKALLVFGHGRNDPRAHALWANYDYSRLKRAMLQHIPRLEYFTWMDMFPQPPAVALGSFAKFKELKELLLDHQMFFGDTEPDLTQLHNYFPPNLQIFEMGGMTLCLWNTIYTRHVLQQDVRLTRIEILQCLASMIPVKKFMLTVDLDCEDPVGHSRLPRILDEPVIGMFRRVADALLAVGATFTVWYRWNVKDKQTKLLVAPEFTTTVIRDAKGEIYQRSDEGDLGEYVSEAENEGD